MEERTLESIQQDKDDLFERYRSLIEGYAQTEGISPDDSHRYTLVMLRLLQLDQEQTDMRLKAIEARLMALEQSRPDAAEPTH